MSAKKIIGIIVSVVFIAAFVFVLVWGIINWNKVKDGLSGSGLYTQDDIQKSYEDGYNTALADKEEYEKLITLPRYHNHANGFNIAVHERGKRAEQQYQGLSRASRKPYRTARRFGNAGRNSDDRQNEQRKDH